MNTIQEYYIKVKALHEMAQAQARKAMAPHDSMLDSGTDEDIETYVDLEMAADRKYGVAELREKLLDTENALLDWAKDEMLKREPTHAETIVFTIDKGRRHLKHREQLLDMASRLAA